MIADIALPEAIYGSANTSRSEAANRAGATPYFGFSLDGADRHYFPVRPEWLHKLPDNVDDMAGSMIEPFTCGYYAIQRSGGTNASETVVVSGGGTIGLATAAAAVGLGARVIVVDPIARRRAVALALVVEAAGHDASISRVFDYANEDGRVAMVGISIGRRIDTNLGQIQMKNLTVRGSIGSPGAWPAAIRFLERTKLDLSPIQTHRFALEDSVAAFELGAQADKCIKVTLLA